MTILINFCYFASIKSGFNLVMYSQLLMTIGINRNKVAPSVVSQGLRVRSTINLTRHKNGTE